MGDLKWIRILQNQMLILKEWIVLVSKLISLIVIIHQILVLQWIEIADNPQKKRDYLISLFCLYSFNPLAIWSGHEVGLKPHFIPSNFSII